VGKEDGGGVEKKFCSKFFHRRCVRSEVVAWWEKKMEELRKNSVPKNKNSVQKREKERIRDLRGISG